MFVNFLLEKSQNFLAPLVERSIVLKSLDRFIFFTISFVLLSSTFAPSDTIGYFAIVGILLTLIKLLTKKDERFYCTKFELCLVIYLAFVLISVAGSSLFYLSLKGVFKTLIYLGYYVCCVHYLKDNKKDIYKFLGIFIFCATYQSLVGFLQHSTNIGELAGWQDVSRLNPEQIMTRVYGTLKPLNPNLFGGYLLSLIPVLYGGALILFFKRHSALGIAMTVLALFVTLVMIMSGCRGIFIAFPIMMLVPVIVSLKRSGKNIRNLLIKFYTAICGLSFMLLMASTSLRARILSIFALRGDSSTSFRLNVYKSALQMFQDNPFLGIGVGNQNFRETYGLYMKTGYDALSAYNIYLETAVESGIFALLAFLGFIILLIKDCFKILFKSRNIEKIIILSIAMTSIVGVLAHGVVDTIFYRPQLQFVFWFMVATIRIFSIK